MIREFAAAISLSDHRLSRTTMELLEEVKLSWETLATTHLFMACMGRFTRELASTVSFG